MLGVYEETGSLTYRTTTRSDVDIVSFLLDRGANLQAVSSYLNRELTEEELSFLIELINKTKTQLINDINIAITEAKVSEFIGELGTIVHKLQEVENYPVLFAIFVIGKKIRIIETVHLGPRRAVHLLEAGNKQLRIGSTTESITRLADVTDALYETDLSTTKNE